MSRRRGRVVPMTKRPCANGSRADVKELLSHAPVNVRVEAARRDVDKDGAEGQAIEALERSRDHWNTIDSPMAGAMVHTLSALIEVAYQGDSSDLDEPFTWARARLGYNLKRADAARAFVTSIAGWMADRKLDGDAFRDRELATELADAAFGWLLIQEPSGLLGDTSSLTFREGLRGGKRRVIQGIQGVAARHAQDRKDAKAFAVAILKGLGLTEAQARDRLKRADF